LVLDAALCAKAILQTCPGVRIIATSRQGLGVDGERIIKVPSLALPPAGMQLSAFMAGRYSAIALFADRAAAATGSFELTDGNVATVVDICRRLDGIALAIELAAARLKMLSVQQLALRLNERFRLLTGGNRTALPRQQTMRALIDWSYDLLAEEERALFRRTAVFNGSFSLDAVAGVCAQNDAESWACFDLLASLVDKSMIASELHGSEQRYRLLESARQYALEKLAASGEEQSVRERHAQYYLRFTEDAERRYFTTPLKAWLASVDPEVDNVRAALDSTLHENHDDRAAQIAGASVWYWLHGKQRTAPIECLEQILAQRAQNDRTTARCAYALAYLANETGDENRARAAAARALAAAEAAGDRESIAHALVCEASAAFLDAAYDAGAAFTRALEIFTELGNQRMVGIALGRYARQLSANGHLEAALPLYERALAMSRAAGDDRTLSQVLNNLAEVAFNTGKPELALKYAGEAVEYAVAARYEPLMRVTYLNMVVYLLQLGMVDDALDRARMALHLAREVHSTIGLSLLSLHFAGLAAERGDFESAAILEGHYMAAFRNFYGPDRDLESTEKNFHAALMDKLQAGLSDERLRRFRRAGAHLPPDELLNRLLAL
jgi:predicted ATPase